MKTTNFKKIVLDPRKLKHHKIASTHRNMNDSEYKTLIDGIEANGQIVPVIVYKGLLVDGRHRQKALLELGINEIKAEVIPTNYSTRMIKDLVLDTENRRSDTVAQKAIRAYRWMLDTDGASQSDAARKIGVTQGRVSEVKKMIERLGIEQVNKLYDQGYLYIGGKRHTRITTILKAIDTKPKDIKAVEPKSEPTIAVFDILNNLYMSGEFNQLGDIHKQTSILLKKMLDD